MRVWGVFDLARGNTGCICDLLRIKGPKANPDRDGLLAQKSAEVASDQWRQLANDCLIAKIRRLDAQDPITNQRPRGLAIRTGKFIQKLVIGRRGGSVIGDPRVVVHGVGRRRRAIRRSSESYAEINERSFIYGRAGRRGRVV